MLKEFITKHQLALFAIITLSIGWFWWAQMILNLWPQEYIIIPSSLGGISPILTLVILQKLSKQEVDLDGIVKTARVGRLYATWLTIGAFLLPALFILGNLLAFVLGLEAQLLLLNPGPDELGWTLLAIVPMTFFPGLLTSPLFEEPGWRGYVLPKLQARFGREIGSLLVGSFWWLWHQMSNISFGLYPSVLGYLSMLGQSFAIDSMFNLSRRNLLVAMFAHQSLFITFTYLYRSPNDLSTVAVVAVIWIAVALLRYREKILGLPHSLVSQEPSYE